MKNRLSVFLLLTTFAFSQNAKPYPHPYIETDINLNGGGYSPLSTQASTGIDIEQKHFILSAFGTYAIVRKGNDGTIGQKTGHQNTATGEAFYRLSNGWYFGGGVQRTQLSTTNYDKKHDTWMIGAGRDFIGDKYSMRLQGMYLNSIHERVKYPDNTSCTANYCTNSGKGFEVNVWYPSPALNKHIFLHESFEMLRFHNYRQTDHAVSSWLTFGLIVRY